MISYGVEDLLNDIVKYARETDEAKKVLLTKLVFSLVFIFSKQMSLSLVIMPTEIL